MLELQSSAFYAAISNLCEMKAWLEAKENDDTSEYHANSKLKEIDRLTISERLRKLPTHFNVLGASVASIAALEAANQLDDDGVQC